MSSNIALNKLNVTNTGNNRLRYDFPTPMTFTKDATLAITNFNLYYSWYNISSVYQNNKFSYLWWDTNGNLTNTVTVTISDGFYSINSLFEYIQNFMVQQGHFLILKSSGDYVYFIELKTNATYYSTELVLSTLSEQMDFGNGMKAVSEYCFLPDASSWKIPVTFETPHFIVQSNCPKFGELIGFLPQTISVDASADTKNKQYSFLNDRVANMEPSSSFLITSNLVDNPYGIPNNVLHAFTIPSGVGFGDRISMYNDAVYSKIKAGTYSYIELVIYDQDFNELAIKDPNMQIVLSIRQPEII